MANIVGNHLSFSMNDSAETQKLLGMLKSDVCDFDFNKIRPIPEELKDNNYSCSIISTAKNVMSYLNQIGQENVTREICDEFGVSSDKEFEEVKNTVDFYRKYNFLNWYQWAKTNWGTKWNSFNAQCVKVNDTHVDYYFYTVDAYPEGILKAVSNLGLDGFMTWVVAVDDEYPTNVVKFESNLQGYYEQVDLNSKECLEIIDDIWHCEN